MIPIIFEGFIDTRFSDLDIYGHVNAKHYLDYVNTTRFRYMEEQMGMTNREIIDRGYMFFLAQSHINYRKPIESTCRIYVKSFVPEWKGPRFNVNFEIQSEDMSITYCQGDFQVILVNNEGRPVRKPPLWLLELFLRQEKASPLQIDDNHSQSEEGAF
ncbi:acyl-CoA thioesterase [Pseudobacteriovorax antillogorgiicola]|uniref:Acyl-CoA thioester hydrolase n=1 Tax=Pseudobacteriovorax antillogorgiicola TaxID=1513793 RepID=A0A1Y6BLB5_9BACT|nr:acyl-CoA thioesterase [Pseudobacteriovorax antillogorgiicola]TCS54611.1 acyl-CoA thioester hydrolase [Pseudobacteriovorax antillogorgiicola]SMF17532.1 acyl-CoA thioester hydrolase [Pseudobacteriovorax antillogorgiicola]